MAYNKHFAERYTNRKRELLGHLKQVKMARELALSLQQKGGYGLAGSAWFELGEVQREIECSIQHENVLLEQETGIPGVCG